MDDDPVVKQLDVVLSKQLLNRLYLIQYPVRPATMTYDNAEHLAVRMKPKQHKVEVELAISTEGTNYNEIKGGEIASNADGGRGGSVNSFFLSDLMDKQVLSSAPVSCDTSRYVIGAVSGDQLHLTPLKAIVQLRPSFNYLDSADAKAEAARMQAAAEKAASAAESSQDEEEAKPLVAKFARHETDEAKARRVASYDYLKRMQDDEPWVKIRHHSIGDRRVIDERKLLFAQNALHHQSFEFSMSQPEYLKKLITQPDRASGGDKTVAQNSPAVVPAQSMSLRDIRSMPMGDQIRSILINGKVIDFARLMSLVSRDISVADTLLSVQQVAQLVQGCWVVKSSLLYPKDSVSGYDSRVTAERLCLARDYLMWRFTLCHSVTRQDIASVVSIPREDEQVILEQLAVRCEDGRDGWQFKYEYDHEFVSQQSEVVSRQARIWEAKGLFLFSMLPINKDVISNARVVTGRPVNGLIKLYSPPTRETLSSPTLETLTHPTARDFQCNARSIVESDEAGDQSLDFINNMNASFLETIVANGDVEMLDVRDLDDLLNNDDNDDVIITDAELGHPGRHRHSDSGAIVNGCLSSTATIKQEPGITPMTPLMNNTVNSGLTSALADFTREKLASRFVLCVSELKELFSIKLAELPPGHVLGAGISDILLERSLIDADAVRMNTTNVRQEALYAWPGHDQDELNPLRAVVIEMLNIKPIIRITALRKRVGDDAISDDSLKRILKEYCFTSGGSWHLKGTKS